MMTVPLGLRIRCISAKVTGGSVNWITRDMNAVSTDASGSDVRWQSSTWKVTFGACACCFATCSIPSETSVASSCSAFAASAEVKNPVPPPEFHRPSERSLPLEPLPQQPAGAAPKLPVNDRSRN